MIVETNRGKFQGMRFVCYTSNKSHHENVFYWLYFLLARRLCCLEKLQYLQNKYVLSLCQNYDSWYNVLVFEDTSSCTTLVERCSNPHIIQSISRFVLINRTFTCSFHLRLKLSSVRWVCFVFIQIVIHF